MKTKRCQNFADAEVQLPCFL